MNRSLMIAVCVLSLLPLHAADWYLPHFTFADAWETRLSLSNGDAVPRVVNVQAWSHEGEDLGSASLTLDAGVGIDRAVTDIISGLAGKKGWLHLQSEANALTGLMRFRHLTAGGTSSLPLVQGIGRQVMLPFIENQNDRASGFAITNLNDTSQSVTVTLRSLDGLYEKQQTLEVAGRAKLVSMAADLFGADLPEVSSIRISSTADIAAFALTFIGAVNQIIAVPGTPMAEPSSNVAEMEGYIRQQMDAAGIPGLSAAVVVDGEITWTGGFGDANRSQGRRVTAQTPFLLASVSKIITGTAVTRAMADGAFSEQSAVNDVIPFEVDNPHVSGERMTISHLLTHYAAIADNWDLLQPLYVNGDSPLELGAFLEQYLTPGGAWYHEDNFYDYAPGEDYEYTNEGVALAGYLVEAGTATPLDRFCEEQLFGPLAMPNTGWHLADFNPADVAVPYVLEPGGLRALEHYGFPDWPNGQCRSSAADMARFLAAVMDGGSYGDTRVLSAEATADMLSVKRAITGDESLTGVGNLWFHFRQDGRSMIGHDGGEEGAGTFLAFDPEQRVGFVVLTNISGDDYDETPVFAIQSRLLSFAEAKKKARDDPEPGTGL